MDITVDNVRGRYRTLKDSYRHARKLEKTNSGFGWEASTERMSADPLCWAELLKTHPEYEKFRHKKVPYYDDLAIIVGDDEANGEDVVTGIEADKDMDQIEDIGISRACDIGEPCINLTDSPSTQVQEDTARGKEKSTKRRRRRGNNSAVESLAEAALRMASSMERPSIKDLQCELQNRSLILAWNCF